MKYVILKTRHFVVDQQPIQRREVINQVFDCRGFAEDCLEDLELYHGHGNVPHFYPREPGELREPTYEIIPAAA